MGKKNTDASDAVENVPDAVEPEPLTPSVSAAAPDGAPSAAPALAPDFDPGRMLGIVGLILAIPLNVVGLIISIIAAQKSKKAGFSNTPAMVGIVIGISATMLVIVGLILAASGLSIAGACDGLSPGIHKMDDGKTVSCY